MKNSEFVSRSQLLLQYLQAVDAIMNDNPGVQNMPLEALLWGQTTQPPN